jgi:hypothetical protein
VRFLEYARSVCNTRREDDFGSPTHRFRIGVGGDRRQEGSVAGLEVRNFDAPDETRAPDKTTVNIVRMGATSASRMSLEPGWRWTMHVVHDDGSEQDICPGQAYVIEPGHDAWVVGDEPVVGYEFDSRTVEEYAKG